MERKKKWFPFRIASTRGSRTRAPLSEGALWEDPGGGLLYLGPWRMCNGRLWRRASLSPYGPRWGNWKGDRIPGTERWMKEARRNGTSLSKEALWTEPRGRTPLLGTPKDMLSKALEMGVCFHKGTAFGEQGGTFLPEGLWEKGKISLFREIFMGNLRAM